MNGTMTSEIRSRKYWTGWEYWTIDLL